MNKSEFVKSLVPLFQIADKAIVDMMLEAEECVSIVYKNGDKVRVYIVDDNYLSMISDIAERLMKTKY